MNKHQKKTSLSTWKEKLDQIYFWEVLAFVIPFVLMGYAFRKAEMHPTGDRQFLVTDLWHQYYPFFQLLWEKLKTGGSLLYSWRTGIGTNFLSLIAYYAASPLNLLSILMTGEQLRDGMMLILMFKFAFAGFFMAKMLKYVFGKNDLSITMFGIMYALCSYMLGYYWNTIWIDTVAMLPLVMMGLAMLVREGKYRLYVISLALALFSNYYIAYFICIFTVLAFFCLCLYENISFKKFFGRFAMITGGSLLGAGISSWILLPTFFALQLTHSADNEFPKTIKWYEAWRDIVSNMLAYTEPTSKEGLPNLYCGLLPVLLLGAFLIAKKIRIREKITAVLLLAFIIVSCNLNYLNFIWHGFHFTNMLPYRFSFLFSFVMLVMAYRAYQVLLEEKLSIIQWLGMLAVGGIFSWLGYGSGIQEDDDHKFVTSSIILGAVYLALILCRYFAPKRVVQVLLAGVLIFEMGAYSIKGVETVGSSAYSSYPANNADIQSLLQTEDESDLFHRTELTMWYTLNDPSLYYYDGVSQFSSMANESVTTYARKLGLPASEAGNRYYYANTSPLTNLLLDVRYILAKDAYNADTLTMTKIGQSGAVAMYENQYLSGLGFMMPESILDYEMDDNADPFARQNELFRQITGIDEDLFTQIDITHVGHQGYDVTWNEYGSYSYSKQADPPGTVFLKYNYTTVQTGMAYAYAKVTNADYLEVYQNNGAMLHKYNIGRQPYITPVGWFESGELINLRCSMKDDAKSGSAYIYFYQLNEDVLKKGYDLIQPGGMTLTSFSDTRLSGTVTASQNGVLYLSIPYEEGWSVTVDGQKSELVSVFDAMCGVKLTPGTHEISLRYSPKGFIPGIFIGFGSIAILVILYFWEKQHPHAEEPSVTEPEPSAPETPEIPEETQPKPENQEVSELLDAYFDGKNIQLPPEPESADDSELLGIYFNNKDYEVIDEDDTQEEPLNKSEDNHE